MIAWLLDSRPRLYAVIGVATVVLLLLVGRSCGNVIDESADAAESESPTVPTTELFTEDAVASLQQANEDALDEWLPDATPTAEPEPEPESEPGFGTEPEVTTADPLALVAAQSFVTALLDTDAPDWPAVSRFATPRLAEAMTTIDPANVPDGKVLGADAVVIGATYQEIEVLIAEGQTIVVSVNLDPTGWVVVDYR